MMDHRWVLLHLVVSVQYDQLNILVVRLHAHYRVSGCQTVRIEWSGINKKGERRGHALCTNPTTGYTYVTDYTYTTEARGLFVYNRVRGLYETAALSVHAPCSDMRVYL
jgi:hypothetical protein